MNQAKSSHLYIDEDIRNKRNPFKNNNWVDLYKEETEQEEKKKDRKAGKLLRSRFLISIQVGACLIILVAALGIRLFGGSIYETVKDGT